MDKIEILDAGKRLASESSGSRIKVLLAVYNAEERAATRAALSETGLLLDIDEADSEQATLHALVTSQYDCALVECDKAGCKQTILDLLARVQTEVIATPVVALTEPIPEEAAIEVLKSGALDYVYKDRITPYALAQSILRAIQVAQQQRGKSSASRQIIRERDEAIVARDAALEASRVKSQFLAFVTHELKTPLGAIIGYADLLAEELTLAPMPELTDNVHKIQEAGKYLGRLIADLLDLSSLEAGKLRLQNDKVQMSDVIADAASITSCLFRENANTLSVEIAPDFPLIEIDDLRLQQILINLLSNASRFTSNGTVTVHVECKDDATRKFLHMTVADTGAGIAEDQLSQLFEPYHQMEMSRKSGSREPDSV